MILLVVPLGYYRIRKSGWRMAGGTHGTHYQIHLRRISDTYISIEAHENEEKDKAKKSWTLLHYVRWRRDSVRGRIRSTVPQEKLIRTCFIIVYR